MVVPSSNSGEIRHLSPPYETVLIGTEVEAEEVEAEAQAEAEAEAEILTGLPVLNAPPSGGGRKNKQGL